MSFFSKIEQACAAFIERAFAKTFPSDLEPAQIARKLVATMEAQTRGEDGGLMAPAGYAVYISPEDYERLAEHRAYLERAWAELLRDLAERVGVGFAGDVQVSLAARPSVPVGAIEIERAGEAAEPHFRLRTVEGVPPDGVYSLVGKSRIGRSEECEILLLDPSVSRTHAVVEVGSGEPVVRDLGSTNGTFVNGRRVERESLRDGDELSFGKTRMRFEAE
ncbi:MAG: FhaA domain-containing protein [Candidatus Baltobacteraceae bacterium]